MRDQLRALENQLVFVQGRIANYSNRNGRKHVCLTRPTVIPWDGQSSFFEAEQKGKIKGDWGESRWFDISAGVRQGCVLSPRLFCSVLEWAMQRWR